MHNNQYLRDEIIRMSGVNPAKCMKCGKCSATCPFSLEKACKNPRLWSFGGKNLTFLPENSFISLTAVNAEVISFATYKTGPLTELAKKFLKLSVTPKTAVGKPRRMLSRNSLQVQSFSVSLLSL